MKTTKNYFQFRFTDDLSTGDVFKISNDSPFYTVLKIDSEKITIQKTFGKLINMSLPIDNTREVMIFPERKKIILTLAGKTI